MKLLTNSNILILATCLLTGVAFGAEGEPDRPRPEGERPPPSTMLRPPPPDGPGFRQHRGRIHRPDPPRRLARPERPDHGYSEETKTLLRNFELQREQFLAEQKALLDSARGASEEQRAALREQILNLRREAQRRRQELRESIEALRDRIPEHRDLLDEATDDARGR